jgi:hypothetical protein
MSDEWVYPADTIFGVAERLKGRVKKAEADLQSARDAFDKQIVGVGNALQQAEAELSQVKAERDKHVQDLAECYRLSGADPDGKEDWRLAPEAVQEVRDMRKAYNKAVERELGFEDKWKQAELERDAAMAVVNGFYGDIYDFLAARKTFESVHPHLFAETGGKT